MGDHGMILHHTMMGFKWQIAFWHTMLMSMHVTLQVHQTFARARARLFRHSGLVLSDTLALLALHLLIHLIASRPSHGLREHGPIVIQGPASC